VTRKGFGVSAKRLRSAQVAESYRFASIRATVSRILSWEGLMQTVAFKAGETIISEGDEGDTAFFIVAGSVEVSIGRGARARMLGALTTGEVFGEMCLIDPGPRSATVTAATDVECLAASYEEFIDAIENHPERAVGFMKTLVRRLRQMNDLLERMGPDRRGLRGLIQDYRKAVGPSSVDPDVAALSWTMLW
jgi:CRP/FNR family transcriptional regulator, cyclic AMP receptor protein